MPAVLTKPMDYNVANCTVRTQKPCSKLMKRLDQNSQLVTLVTIVIYQYISIKLTKTKCFLISKITIF